MCLQSFFGVYTEESSLFIQVIQIRRNRQMSPPTCQMLDGVCIIYPKFCYANACTERKTCRRTDVLKRHFFTRSEERRVGKECCR